MSQAFGCTKRPLITTTDDPVLRMELIRQARSFVLASKRSRRAKAATAEDERIDREIDREERNAGQQEDEKEDPKSNFEKRRNHGTDK